MLALQKKTKVSNIMCIFVYFILLWVITLCYEYALLCFRNLAQRCLPNQHSNREMVLTTNFRLVNNNTWGGNQSSCSIKFCTSGYHWDCSDWARTDQRPLPNITEVPGSEVPDSSSFHSNESNESSCHHTALPPVHGPIDPARDIDTLPEDQEDSEIPESDQNESEYRFHGSDAYLRHPNVYLPRYNMTSASERDDSDDEYGYGFPPKHEASALLGSLTNVCDIGT